MEKLKKRYEGIVVCTCTYMHSMLLIMVVLFCTNTQYNDLLKKKKIVENDKAKIAELIAELDQKKNEALQGAYERVNKVCVCTCVIMGGGGGGMDLCEYIPPRRCELGLCGYICMCWKILS